MTAISNKVILLWIRELCQLYVSCSQLKLGLVWCLDPFLLQAFLSFSRTTHSFGNVTYRWKASNLDLCSALMSIEQWGFFSVPHLLWHVASVYNGHLRGPVTLALIAERLAVELSYMFLRLRSAGIRTPILNLSLAGRNCHGIGIFWNWSLRHDSYYCWMLFYESPLTELIFAGKIVYFTNSNYTKVCVTLEFFFSTKMSL